MYQYVLKGGQIADGTGNPLYAGDVCIQDGKIAAIVPSFHGECDHVLDVTGKTIAPGFIDIHTHSDTVPLTPGLNPESKLYQGITLEITGNCGISHLPVPPDRREAQSQYYNTLLPASMPYVELVDESVSDYAEHVAQNPPAANYGVLIGHGTLRGAVMGFDMRDPTPQEQKEMEELLARNLDEGAFGMSLGLIYPPSSFAKLEELVGLAKVLADRDCILAVHMRNESDRVFEAVEEMLEVARLSGVHLEISHLKLMGRAQWGRTDELLQRLDRARREGIKVTCDQYPYNASSTGLSALAPGWAHDGGVSKLTERCKAPSQQLLHDIQAEMDRRGGPAAVLLVGTNGRLPECQGKTLEEISAMWNVTPAQAAASCLAQCESAVSCIYFTMDFEDVCNIMKDMNIAVGSDGVGHSYEQAAKFCHHPRSFGTFPRFLQTVRERNLMPLEKAVYKMTGLPASILGLKDRGVIKEGLCADLTVFDWNRVADRSTYTKSAVKPAGIEYVFVAGQLSLDQGEQTSARAGRVLRHGL